MKNPFETLQSEVGPEVLRRELDVYADPRDYISELTASYRQSSLIPVIFKSALLVDPEGRLPDDRNESLPEANAFYAGGILGWHVGLKFLTPAVRRFMPNMDQGYLEVRTLPEGIMHYAHLDSDKVMKIADSGFNRAAVYHSLFAELEDQIHPDVRMQPYFRRGFGFVMSMIDLATEMQVQVDSKVMEGEFNVWELENGWDGLIERILKADSREAS